MRENSERPSLVELARRGNFQAIAYWLNQSLIPAGIYASVGASRQGCLGIWIELPPLDSNNWYLPTLQRQVVRFICHQIWKLNSEAIEGVRIVARLAGQRRVLWKQSVRIVTPAHRDRQGEEIDADSPSADLHSWRDTCDTVIRTMPIVGTAALAFAVGFWAIARDRRPACDDPPCSAEPSTEPSTPASPISPIPQIIDTLEVEGERLSVFAPPPSANPDDPAVTVLLAGDAGADLTQSDVTVAGGDASEMSPQSAAIGESGVDVVDLALEDARTKADTNPEAVDFLENAGLPYIGAGTPPWRPTIVEVKDRRVAFLSYETAQVEDDRFFEAIRAIRDRVDWVVANLHWEGELGEIPDPWQVNLARGAIEAGADVVAGYHPRVLQGGEIYRDRPIVYAIGSFQFGELSQGDFDTAAIEVSLKDDRLKLDVLPVEVRDFQPQIVRGESGRAITEAFEARSATFDRPLPLSAIFSWHPDAEPTANPGFPESPPENLDSDLEIDPDFGDTPKEWQRDAPVLRQRDTPLEPLRERGEPDTDLLPDADPTEEESDPFIDDPFIAPASESDNDKAKPQIFPRLQLPFEPKPAPDNREAQSRRSIDLPPFILSNQ